MNLTVRTATAADKPQLAEMARLFWADNGITDCEDELLDGALNQALSGQRGIIGVIGAPGGTVEAMVCLAITRFFWTRKVHLEDVMSFVRPEFRAGGEHAEALVEFSKRCSSKDCPLVVTIFANKKMAGKAAIYRRHMGNPSALVFTFNQDLAVEKPEAEFWDTNLPKRKTRGRGGQIKVAKKTSAAL